MRPEAAELRIGLEAGQKIIRNCCDRIVPTKALVKGLLLVAHPQSFLGLGTVRNSHRGN
jgi:hypothetical protein